MTVTPDQIARLPKWAQERITTLEQDVAYWKSRAYEAATEGETDTRVESGLVSTDERFRGLPSKSTIRFGTEKNGHYLSVRTHNEGGEAFHDGFVEILVSSASQFIVIPKASNMVLIRDLYRFS